MIEDNLRERCSVIMASCSAYSDVWKAFFTLFFEYWPDCPLDVYLVSDKLGYEDARVKSIVLERDKGWSANMREALAKIPTPYFILFVEDFLLLEKVNSERIKDLLTYFEEHKLDYLRLYPAPGPDENFDSKIRVGEIALNAPYRLSLMTAIWRKETFLKILDDKENAWELELNGSERVRSPEYKFWSVLKDEPALNYFATAIKKGVWLYDADKFCLQHGVTIDRSRRSVETRGAYLKRRFSKVPFVGRIFAKLYR